ncbi:hypothetical protein JSY36_18815 [Bacillus sp. H-16]|uniref:hypothetical protein n=1 Tax=Alteribacter salitolerans TaxID=2912333 RepID=UPI0019646873|nr:hypothetical protein [Alteribacter salitolerans]MBM7097792.1 hypothetical protein [Alteribacter salitolerans]
MDRFLGFLPARGALISAVVYGIICYSSLKISGKMTSSYSLPWQKEENRKFREQMKKEEEKK